MKIPELKAQYETICTEYIKKFCKKQGFSFTHFDGWIGEEIGGIAGFMEQYFFYLSDIIYDVNTKQPKGLILAWQDEGVDAGMAEYIAEGKTVPQINYYSYSKGLRIADIKKQNEQNEK